jgi:hypothetical protein
MGLSMKFKNFLNESKKLETGDRVISLVNVSDAGGNEFQTKPLKGKRGKIIGKHNQLWAIVEFNEDIMDDDNNRRLIALTDRGKNTKRVYWVKYKDLKKDNIGTGRFDKEMVVEGKEI